ncbi:hypothetical protein DSO57_1019093 [Entomophthora muscae]|uniref:Uncharacterized protein n=1 Tax=Entomophthora muscae TaxID=34485 RepID=A0ACC2TF49_9FUNG|nr:hypothetical protein DSO57_1019093 [Entomophthora muscae]
MTRVDGSQPDCKLGQTLDCQRYLAPTRRERNLPTFQVSRLEATQVPQSGLEPTNLLSCRPELLNCSKTHQTLKDDSPNGHQIAINCVPPKTQTYDEVVTCLKEVATKTTASAVNDHQQLPVFRPEWAIQFDCLDDVVNSSSGTKHHHLCSPEQAQLGSTARKTRRQGPNPASELSPDLKSVKSKEAKPPVIRTRRLSDLPSYVWSSRPSGNRPLQIPTCQPSSGTIPPPGAPFGPVHFTRYPPNPAYLEYNLETILIADPLARTRGTKYIGHKGKWYKRPPRLFKDKYNYLSAYFVPMTPPLTPQPNRPMEPPTAAETMSTQLFGVLYITLTGIVDSMVPNSGPWSFLGQSVSYIIKLAPIPWCALPTGPSVPCHKSTNASTYARIPERFDKSCKKGFSLKLILNHHNQSPTRYQMERIAKQTMCYNSTYQPKMGPLAKDPHIQTRTGPIMPVMAVFPL